MTVADLSAEPVISVPGSVQGRFASRRASAAGMWGRVVLACAILGASGGVRWWQSQRVQAWLKTGEASPFPLRELPAALGTWRGEPTTPDEQIVRATGSTDSVFRRYVDQATGVWLDVYVLYGPAVGMFIHKPETCYPNAGFREADRPAERSIAVGSARAPFRTLVYAKGEGGQSELQEVYYAWRWGGRWSPDTGTLKQLERVPGMYKVHLVRRITARERRDVGNPCEAFLQELLPELERRLAH